MGARVEKMSGLKGVLVVVVCQVSSESAAVVQRQSGVIDGSTIVCIVNPDTRCAVLIVGNVQVFLRLVSDILAHTNKGLRLP